MTQPSISHADGVPSVFCHSTSAAIQRSRRDIAEGRLAIGPNSICRTADAVAALKRAGRR
jgi:hypothetical protein